MNLKLLDSLKLLYYSSMNSNNITYFTHHWQVFWSICIACNKSKFHLMTSIFLRIKGCINDFQCTYVSILTLIRITSIKYNGIEVHSIIGISYSIIKLCINFFPMLSYSIFSTFSLFMTTNWIWLCFWIDLHVLLQQQKLIMINIF